MWLIAGLTAAALSGLAAAATQQSADVYTFPSQSSSSQTTPSIPREIARHILLQRTSRQRYGSDLRDIPSSIDTETAIAHIARFGKSPAPLFTRPDKNDASQLVVLFEGAAAEQSNQIREKLGQHAAFTISDPPSATANNHLMTFFRNLGVSSSHQCELSAMINPFEADCWTGPSSVVKYDLRKSPKTLESLFDNLSRLENFVSAGDLELLLVVLPESSRFSKFSHWSAAAAGSSSELRRRRDTETVISDQELDHINPTTKPAAKPTTAASTRRTKKAFPQCFASLNSCMTQTNSCSGHGKCVDKYATPDGSGGNSSSSSSTSAASCFVCVCQATVVEHGGEGAGARKGRKTVRWGGSMCQKEDVSVPFWLIAGFTVTIVGAVSFAIGLLFSVGEEKLPGVIGAGVSRSK
ncbi:hypothetical protein N657DRAFT_687087 [Parathielavia appendiculata]|uniref:Vacuolar sorting protein Vps3844 C-terminal domain-containing protein n=1 Tax=Parathielavia appendiculata TaxID=2587402 RepID=A0AAN6ZA19_9PEZI|nr:hypothetical protein N657DRAFT_687087 [Parathielavia appendiculata]